MRHFLQIITAIIFLIVGKYFSDDHLKPHFIAEGLIVLLSVLIVDIGYGLFKNYKRVTLIIKCWILALKGEYIRFSMSYQYRIKINDKYLLVKNSNWGFYQHVGGKYKRLPITIKVLQDFEARDDIKLPTIGLMKDDLAVFIPAKNAIKFLDWFNSRKDREISHWREFYEELVEGKSKIVSRQNFPYVNYTYVKSIVTPLKKAKAPGWKCWEILQYDVLDLLPTKQQEQEFEELFNAGDTDYLKWADNELIQNLGHNNHERKVKFIIADHAKWVVNLKWSKD